MTTESGIEGLQQQLVNMAVAETNKLRIKVRQLEAELAMQLPTIYLQQERITLLELYLAKESQHG